MPITIFEYVRAREIVPELRRLQGEASQSVFLVPSPFDEEWLLNRLSEDRGYFGRTPRLIRWDGLHRECLAAIAADGNPLFSKRQIDPPDHWLILHYLLQNFLREKDSENIPPGVKRPGFLSLLGDQLRELLREEVTPEDLRATLGCDRCFWPAACDGSSTPTGLLCRFYRDYRQYLDQNGLADSAEIATLTKEAILLRPEAVKKWLEAHRLVLVGFMSLTHGQLSLLRELDRLGGNLTLFKPATGISSAFDAAKQLKVSPLAAKDLQTLPLSGREWAAGNTRMEIETLCRELALWNQGKGRLAESRPFPGFGEIGMLVEEERLDLAIESLERFRIPWTLRGRQPLSRGRFFNLLRRLWDLYEEGWPEKGTRAFLSEPCLGLEAGSLDFQAASTPVDFKTWLKSLPHSTFERLERFCLFLARGGTPLQLLSATRDLANEAPSWGSNLTLLAGEDFDYDRFVFEVNAIVRELERKVLMLEELVPSLGEAKETFFSGKEAFSFIEAWGRESHFPPNLQRKEVLSLFVASPPVLEGFSVWILAGCSSRIWPGGFSDPPLLDDETREVMNRIDRDAETPRYIPRLHDLREQREALFRRLLATGEEWTLLSRPLQDEDARPLAPSPFLEKAREEGWIAFPDPPIVRFLSDLLPDASEPWFFSLEYPKDLSREPRSSRQGEIQIPPLTDSAKGPVAYYSDFDTWLACPFYYACLKRAGLPVPPKEELYDPQKAGTFLHCLWQKVWEKTSLADETPLCALVDALWEETLINNYGALLSDPRLRRREADLKRKARRLALLQEECRELERPLSTGEGPFLEWKLPSKQVEGVLFEGRCDRVDCLKEGVVIWDYKLGKAESKKGSLQLAAYAWALEQSQVPVLGFGFLGHEDGKMEGCFREPLFPGLLKKKRTKSLEERLLEAEEGIVGMAQSIARGYFKAQYEKTPNKPNPLCRFCPFKGLCRRSEQFGERPEAEEKEGENGYDA